MTDDGSDAIMVVMAETWVVIRMMVMVETRWCGSVDEDGDCCGGNVDGGRQ